MRKELLEKAKTARSCDELLSFANGEGIELDRAKAEKIFSSFKDGVEITDDLLSSVSGARLELYYEAVDEDYHAPSGGGC